MHKRGPLEKVAARIQVLEKKRTLMQLSYLYSEIKTRINIPSRHLIWLGANEKHVPNGLAGLKT